MGLRIRSRLRARRGAGPAADQAPRSNIDENREYWNTYAHHWTKERGAQIVESTKAEEQYAYLGDEWGSPDDVTAILDEFVFPHLRAETVAVEIGSGGGRIASRVAPRVKHLFCLDISSEMFRHLRVVLADRDNVSFVHVPDAVFPSEITAARPDFIYSFDVFVHLDLHTMWTYIEQIGAVLPPGGKVFLHTSNLRAAVGWRRIAAQAEYSLGGHYFITPETLKTLARDAGLSLLHESDEDPSNFYKARDYLVVLQK